MKYSYAIRVLYEKKEELRKLLDSCSVQDPFAIEDIYAEMRELDEAIEELRRIEMEGSEVMNAFAKL